MTYRPTELDGKLGLKINLLFYYLCLFYYYTKILEVICLHLPTDCFVEISPHSTGHISPCIILLL